MTSRTQQLCPVEDAIVDIAGAVTLPNITCFPLYRKMANGQKTDIVASTPVLQVVKVLNSRYSETDFSVLFTPVPCDEDGHGYLVNAAKWEGELMARTFQMLGTNAEKTKHRRTFDYITNPYCEQDKVPCMKVIMKRQPSTWLWGSDPSKTPINEQFPNIGFREGQRVVFNYSIKRIGKAAMVDTTKFFVDVGLVFLVSSADVADPLFQDFSAIPGSTSIDDLLPRLDAQFSKQLTEDSDDIVIDNGQQHGWQQAEESNRPSFVKTTSLQQQQHPRRVVHRAQH